MPKRWLLYGAYGYTGRLIARAAHQQGLRPVLAGRDEQPLQALARELNLEHRVLDLRDERTLADEVAQFDVVLHCAGPFSATSAPMMDACLAGYTHYVDITGEIDVFAGAHRQHNAAVSRNVVLLCGAGFDVVPSDCLAAQLKDRLVNAQSLVLAFDAQGGPSPGTVASSMEGLAQGGRVRRKGTLAAVALGHKTREIPFRHGRRLAMTIPWGDVYTAFVSTGIPDIEVYMALPEKLIRRRPWIRLLQPALSVKAVRDFLARRFDAASAGPDAEKRANTHSYIWGEVRNRAGEKVQGDMVTPNGYEMTVHASLGIVAYLLNHRLEGGYYTPSTLMGSDYAASLPGVEVRID